ncbi:MAG: hypothetical protein WD963_00300, partial [Candidatus Paceibacterota bacterium]
YNLTTKASINNYMQKIKPSIINWLESEKGKDVLIVMIVILVGLGSFQLGRLSKDNTSSGIKIEYPSLEANQGASVVSAVQYPNTNSASASVIKNSVEKNFFASSRGKKYYPVGCSAGKSLKLENRVYFATKEEAESKGYELSSSCK